MAPLYVSKLLLSSLILGSQCVIAYEEVQYPIVDEQGNDGADCHNAVSPPTPRNQKKRIDETDPKNSAPLYSIPSQR